MASNTLRLVNRSPKQPIKRLPASVEYPRDATVEDLKKIIARQAGVSDFNRIGLFDPTTKKIIKNRNALIKDQQDVMSTGELLVKDLGLQLSWRFVFVVEYFGPLLLHPLLIALRPYIYPTLPFDLPSWWPYSFKNGETTPMTQVQWLVFAFIILHFLKRELETMYLHKFSANTMPAWNIFRNSFFYWFSAGLVGAYDVYAPGSLSSRNDLGLLDWVGIALFFNGEICNYIVHKHLASLRKPGGTERGIPHCIGSHLVTCPNYMFEVIAWVGIIIVSRSWAIVVFIFFGIMYMRDWSKGKERSLRQEFGDRYKAKKFTMLPGLI
ncbi:3-oxo-5-alpha-steroid 4-dehydrogenase-domain-containing protein [Coniochaeta sp. 2T2.1]|nr:3-oxo-5-alpha-steroid 4-dehydrogenase-domain-containing protein [Coniochaeta sp. 2T2.1]